jgi:hypothetical protein
MADKTEITLILQPGGEDVENNNFRTNDAYRGQVERVDVADKGKKLNLQVTLVDVIHGTFREKTAEIDPKTSSPVLSSVLATLIIADFRFTSHGPRRFKRAKIELRFKGANDENDSNPPAVCEIAPMGSWGLQKTEKTRENTRGAKLTAGGTFVANVSGELDWNLTETITSWDEATIDGVNTQRDRHIEPKNAAVWSMAENDGIEKGIPSLLRTAILLKRNNDNDFYCFVKVDTKVNLSLPGWSPSIESREAGKGDTDHVLMSPTKKRTKPPIAGIKESRLDEVILSSLMGVTMRESIAPPLAATVLTEDRNSDMMLEEAKWKAEQPAKIATRSESAPTGVSLEAERVVHAPDTALKNTILDPLRAIGIHPSNDSVPNLERSPPRERKVEEESSVEDTLRLLLHAVRKGVEVIAEAVRISRVPPAWQSL